MISGRVRIVTPAIGEGLAVGEFCWARVGGRIEKESLQPRGRGTRDIIPRVIAHIQNLTGSQLAAAASA